VLICVPFVTQSLGRHYMSLFAFDIIVIGILLIRYSCVIGVGRNFDVLKYFNRWGSVCVDENYLSGGAYNVGFEGVWL
jgi:hypothetical protein